MNRVCFSDWGPVLSEGKDPAFSADLFNLEPYSGYLATKRPETAKNYRDRLRWLHVYLTHRGLSFSEIGAKHLMDFMTWRKVTSKVSSMRVTMYAVGGLFKYLEATEQIPRNPAKILYTMGYKKPKPNPRPLDIEIRRRLLESLSYSTLDDARQSLVVLLGLHAGLRRAEICGIRWEDVDFDGGLMIEGEWVKTGMVRVMGKGEKPRRLPMTPTLRAALNEFQARYRLYFHGLFPPEGRGDYLFRSPRTYIRGDLQPGHSQIERLFGMAKARGTLTAEKFTLHCLRHTFATMLGESGCNAYEIRDLLGHSSIDVSEHYVGTTERQAHTALVRVFGGKIAVGA